MKIIYQGENNTVVLVNPSPEALQTYTIEQIALKDVPFGVPFKIVQDNEIPSDFTFFDAWTVDVNDLTDGVGAESNLFEDLP
jgi:hypothetical protein